MKEVGYRLTVPLWGSTQRLDVVTTFKLDKLWIRIWSTVPDQIRQQVGGGVRNRIGSLVWDRVGNALVHWNHTKLHRRWWL